MVPSSSAGRRGAKQRKHTTHQPHLRVLGYACIQEGEDAQVLRAQIDGLTAARCTRIYLDHLKDNSPRPERDRLLDSLQAGDKVVMWSLNVLGSDARSLLLALQTVLVRGADISSIEEAEFHVRNEEARGVVEVLIDCLIGVQRRALRDRSRRGAETARKVGQKLGRGSALTAKQIASIVKQRETPSPPSYQELAKGLSVSPATVYRAHLRAVREGIGAPVFLQSQRVGERRLTDRETGE